MRRFAAIWLICAAMGFAMVAAITVGLALVVDGAWPSLTAAEAASARADRAP